MGMDFVYSTSAFISILELLCGLLIVGTIVKKFQDFRKFTQGAVLIVIAGFVIVAKQLFSLAGSYVLFPNEMYDLFIYLFFAIGILYFSDRLTMFEKKEERHEKALLKKRELREKYTPKSVKRKQRRKRKSGT